MELGSLERNGILSFFLLFFLLLSNVASAYTHNKIIMLVSRDLQKDSIGFNLVDDVARWAYVKILTDEAKLWDSPDKKNQITSKDLVKTEMNKGCRFVQASNLFIYETFSQKKRKIKFTTLGFSFTGTDANGKEISYGYLELTEKLKQSLKKNYSIANADGNYGLNVYQALTNKQFVYDIIFFQDEVVPKIDKSNKIKAGLIGNRKITSSVPTEEVKYIQYNIESGPSLLAKHSGELVDALQKFFNENPQEFYNNGGDKILDPLKKKPIILTSFKVLELWEKKYGVITQNPVKIIPYAFGVPIDTIPVSQFKKWKFKKDGEDLLHQLEKKNFYFSLERVNATPVKLESTNRWVDALQKAPWNGVMEYLVAHSAEE